MLRSVQVDLKAAMRALVELGELYARDLEAEEISDDVIDRVGIIVRNLNAALDKTADGVQTNLYERSTRTYFPLVADEARFEAALDRSIKGLRDDHPEIADAIRRHQPFHRPILNNLKPLYREFAHHDFVLQRREETSGTTTFAIGGFAAVSIGPEGIQVGGNPWRGFPIKDGKVWRPDAPSMSDMSLSEGTFVDWHFVDPSVSVIGTLRPLIDACGQAAFDVSYAAGLGDLAPGTPKRAAIDAQRSQGASP
jgi:hypothetical protein